MRAQRESSPKGLSESMILFTVAGFKFVIAAAAVTEIRSAVGLERFSPERGHRAAGKVDHILQRNGATFFVVNAARYFGVSPAAPDRVLVLRHSAAAVLVDSTDRMLEVSVLRSLPLAFTRDERRWYRGLTMLNGDVLPVVDPDAFLSRGEIAVLRAMMDIQPAQGVPVG